MSTILPILIIGVVIAGFVSGIVKFYKSVKNKNCSGCSSCSSKGSCHK